MIAPFDSVVLLSFGGPEGPDDVLPFMRNVTAGKNIPDERLVEVSGHYQRFGGVSPINARTEELRSALEAELAARGAPVPVVVGNRNWHPFLADTLRALAATGATRPVAVITSAYSSYSGCRTYRESLADAVAAVDAFPGIAKVRHYFSTTGFLRANADALAAALRAEPDAAVAFVTHSIPVAMEEASGDPARGLTYAGQHRLVAAAVARAAGEELGREIDWELVYCSRSGSPRTPWLEPDVNDHLEALHAAGATAVVTAPIGFITDHMEVVYDLDTEAAATAERLGLRHVRAATAGTHPAFVASLADVIAERAAEERGEAARPTDPLPTMPATCTAGCCLTRPGAPARPALCGH